MSQSFTNSEDESMEKLHEVIRGIEIAMMTTVSGDGALYSRPMITLEARSDDHLWFFAHGSSETVRAVVRNPQVNLAYADADEERFVSVSGRAERVIDPRKAEQLWVPQLREYFKGGVDDPDLVLLKVHVDTAEYWDAPPSWLMKAFRFRPIASNDPVAALS